MWYRDGDRSLDTCNPYIQFTLAWYPNNRVSVMLKVRVGCHSHFFLDIMAASFSLLSSLASSRSLSIPRSLRARYECSVSPRPLQDATCRHVALSFLHASKCCTP